jgi:LmbE family N-acetylglucosaminyl deacetylase
MATRRAEDRVALAQLGAAWVHLTVPDAPYRTQAAGQALYTDEAALFGRVHPQDAAPHTPFSLPATLTALYVPLGAGQHVDHQVVREIGLKFREKVALFYYEEYPYSANNMEALYASGAAQTRLYGSTAVAAAQARLPFPLQAQVVALTEANMDAKIRAIACYRSQISTFWESEPHMAQRVRAYAREIAEPAAERLWFEVKEKRK